MKKGYLITAVVILLAVLIVVGVFLRDDISDVIHSDGTTAAPVIDTDSDGYVCMVKGSVDNADPIMKTDIDGVYYTMKKDGTVSFFKVEGTQIAQVAESGSYDVQVNCTNQNIPATIHYYLADDGRVAGYGLFTTENSDAEVYVYEYAFFKMMNLPDSYAADSSYLILVDTTKEDFYSNEKVFEENFTFRTSDGSTENILSNANRAFDETGAFRADYAMLTEDAVKKCGEHFLFFSARQYHLFTKDKNMDLYMAGGSGNNKDNNRYIEDIVDFYFRFDQDGRVVVLKRNGDSAFRVIAFDGSGETVIKEFSGNYAEQYLRSGDYILNKENLEIYNIATGESSVLSVADANHFTPDIFVADGKNVFLRGISENAPAIVLGTVSDGCTCFYNSMFSRIFSPVILADGSVMVSVANDAAGSSYSIKIFGTSVPKNAEN